MTLLNYLEYLDRFHLGVAIVGLTIIYNFTIIIYRLFFHPLKDFPGPRLAAITNYYEAWFNLVRGGQLVYKLEKLHAQYDSTAVRIGPNKLHFSDPHAYHAIYSTADFQKDPYFYGAFGILNTAAFITMPDAMHRARRELMNKHFSKRNILELQTLVQVKIDKLVAGLRGYCGNGHEGAEAEAGAEAGAKKSVNLNRAFRCMTADIIMQFCFGSCLDLLDAHEMDYSHPIIVAIEEAVKGLWWRMYMPPIHFFTFYIAPAIVDYLPSIVSGMAECLKLVADTVDSLLRDPSILTSQSHPTVYNGLLNPKNPSTPIPSRMHLIHEGVTLQVAGSDTVGNTLTHGTAHIVSQPAIQARIFAELLTVWPNLAGPVPRYEVLETLPYLQAVIKESLRVSIGVRTPMPRVSLKPTTIAGHHVPAGSIVAIGHSFVHFNSTIFPDPQRFVPDRWLGDEDSSDEDERNDERGGGGGGGGIAKAKANSKSKWLAAFSRGPRSCQGIHLAYCELTLTMAHVFRRFEVVALDGCDLERDLSFRDFFLPHYTGRHVRGILRERTE